ncbi:MAG TPA: PPC domain-containing protein [Coleofasciculaceae cyanobacterium]
MAKSTLISVQSREIKKNLDAGVYYISLKIRNGKTRYRLNASTTSFTGAADPGSSLETASDSKVLAGAKNYRDSVGLTDQADYYKFRLNQISDFSASLSGLVGSAKITLIHDTNQNNFVDGNEILASGSGSQYGNSPISKTLPPGVYFIEVKPYISYGDTNYALTLAAVGKPGNIPGDPGNTLDAAYALGTLSTPLIVKDLVGSLDEADYYKFTLAQNSQFNATLSGVSNSVDISLIRDANSNGFIDGNETVASGSGSTYNNIPISETLPSGTYFLAVKSYSTADNTKYDLNLSATAQASDIVTDPGSSLQTAYDLGAIASPATARELVGALDNVDYYKFSLSKSSPLNATLSGLSDSVFMYLFQDSNGNNLIDGGEQITSGFGSTYGNNPISKTLQAGTYYMEVKSLSSYHNTTYTLTLGS